MLFLHVLHSCHYDCKNAFERRKQLFDSAFLGTLKPSLTVTVKPGQAYPYGFYEQTAYWSQVTLRFFLHILFYIIYSGTFPLEHPCSRDTSIQGKQQFGLRKTSTYSLPSVTSIEGRPLFRGKGHIFLVPKPGFNLHSWDTLALIT